MINRKGLIGLFKRVLYVTVTSNVRKIQTIGPEPSLIRFGDEWSPQERTYWKPLTTWKSS